MERVGDGVTERSAVSPVSSISLCLCISPSPPLSLSPSFPLRVPASPEARACTR